MTSVAPAVKMAEALSHLKFPSNDKKVIWNSSSIFSGNLDRNIIDFMNDEDELLITFEKDTVQDVHIAASEGTPLINISVTSNLSELEAFIDKEHDEYVVWRNNNSLLSKNTSSASECVTVYGTFNNTKVSTGCLKSAISTESSTNNNHGLNDAISSGAGERYLNGENCLCSFLMEEIKFLRSEIKFKNKIIKSLFTSKSMLHNEQFFLINQSKLKIVIKTSIKKLIIQRKFFRDMLTKPAMIMTYKMIFLFQI